MVDGADPRPERDAAALTIGFERSHDGTLVASDARAVLASMNLDTLAGAFAFPAIRRSAWKSWARIELPGVGVAFLKRWDYSRLDVWLRGALKWNWPTFSGPRELEKLVALAAAGLRVPRPLAAGELDEGARRRSFSLLLDVGGTRLEALTPPAAPRARRAMIDAVADIVGRLHAAAFAHKDLYCGNVFWDPERGPALIDCERAERWPRGIPWRWRVKDLGALAFSAPDAWSRADRARFMRGYLKVARVEHEGRRLERAALNKARSIARRGAKGV